MVRSRTMRRQLGEDGAINEEPDRRNRRQRMAWHGGGDGRGRRGRRHAGDCTDGSVNQVEQPRDIGRWTGDDRVEQSPAAMRTVRSIVRSKRADFGEHRIVRRGNDIARRVPGVNTYAGSIRPETSGRRPTVGINPENGSSA